MIPRQNGLQLMTDPSDFWAGVDKSGDCWIWTMGKGEKGYGRAKYQDKNWSTHRLSWVLSFGPIPKGIMVCHTCDNPPCVRPSHLFLGTALDNMRDMQKKGRDRKDSPKGSRNGHAKLTEQQVEQIRSMYATGSCSMRQLATRFKIHQRVIFGIIKGELWKHVPVEQSRKPTTSEVIQLLKQMRGCGTQADLARRLRMSQTQLSYILKGKSNPGPKFISSLLTPMGEQK